MSVRVFRHSPKDVVGFVPFDADDRAAGQIHELPAQGHLGTQFLRHGGAVALVCVVHFVPEGGGVQVVGGNHYIRLVGRQQFLVGLSEPKKGVGFQAVLGGQVADGVKGAVHQGVKVYGKNFHSKILSGSFYKTPHGVP